MPLLSEQTEEATTVRSWLIDRGGGGPMTRTPPVLLTESSGVTFGGGDGAGSDGPSASGGADAYPLLQNRIRASPRQTGKNPGGKAVCSRLSTLVCTPVTSSMTDRCSSAMDKD